MPEVLQATLWGLVGGAALVLGAAVAWRVRVPPRAVAAVMAFGAGVLIAALAFDLVEEAVAGGGLTATGLGLLGGAGVYVLADAALARRGAQHRKRSGDEQPSEEEQGGSGAAIAVGALLDGVPESVVLGASLIGGGGVSVGVLVAVFLSNVPEGLSSATGMRNAGRPAAYVFGVWSGIAVLSAVAAGAGFLLLDGAAPQVLSAITAVAAGAILAMISNTMLPEAVRESDHLTGLVTVLGFLTAVVVQQHA